MVWPLLYDSCASTSTEHRYKFNGSRHSYVAAYMWEPSGNGLGAVNSFTWHSVPVPHVVSANGSGALISNTSNSIRIVHNSITAMFLFYLQASSLLFRFNRMLKPQLSWLCTIRAWDYIERYRLCTWKEKNKLHIRTTCIGIICHWAASVTITVINVALWIVICETLAWPIMALAPWHAYNRSNWIRYLHMALPNDAA